jgi:hypothetical protein
VPLKAPELSESSQLKKPEHIICLSRVVELVGAMVAQWFEVIPVKGFV